VNDGPLFLAAELYEPDAGWRASNVNLTAERVRFLKERPD
jgi:hypothetical protein